MEDRTVPAAFTVTTLADGGAGSLRQAVLDANAAPGPDTIGFAAGLSGTIALATGQLSITDHLSIDGPGADQLAVSGGHQSRVFGIGGGVTASIARLTIMGGRVSGAAADGGAIVNTGGTLTLDRVVVSDNQAVVTGSGMARGGAVANLAGATLTVTDSLFTNNRALGGPSGTGNGGGIFNLTSSLTMTGSTFSANHAVGGSGSGGALGGGLSSTTGSTATITDCTFVGNQALAGDGGTGVGFGRGGGIVNFFSVMTVENSRILDNVARGGSGSTRPAPRVGFASGGGIFTADAATLFLTGSIVRGNRALGGSNNTCNGGNGFVGNAQGGGLTNVGTTTITDCLFADNEARGGNNNRGDGVSHQYVGTGFGGGIASTAGDPTGNPTRLTLQNVTVRHNRAVGGEGNTAGTLVNAGIGGGVATNGSNNNAPQSSGSTTTILDCTVAHNQAVGGHGGAALGGGTANQLGALTIVTGSTLAHNQASGGESATGFGGGLYNGPASTHPSNLDAATVLIVRDSLVAHNVAWGGDGARGARGSDGLGGGVFNDKTAHLVVRGAVITHNHANGGIGSVGGNNGSGIGGGLYNLGVLDLDVFTVIRKNHASTSHDDIFS